VKLSEADEQAIVRAIANAERENRGEVRVHFEATCPTKDPVARARDLYGKLGLNRTKDDTAVLVYVAHRSKRCAVWSGAGIHPRADAAFWQSVTDAVAMGAKSGQLAQGLVNALKLVGELLRKHVPGRDVSGNELPDSITTEKDVS
jgi:uncharacterized membrane protein